MFGAIYRNWEERVSGINSIELSFDHEEFEFNIQMKTLGKQLGISIWCSMGK